MREQNTALASFFLFSLNKQSTAFKFSKPILWLNVRADVTQLRITIWYQVTNISPSMLYLILWHIFFLNFLNNFLFIYNFFTTINISLFYFLFFILIYNQSDIIIHHKKRKRKKKDGIVQITNL